MCRATKASELRLVPYLKRMVDATGGGRDAMQVRLLKDAPDGLGLAGAAQHLHQQPRRLSPE